MVKTFEVVYDDFSGGHFVGGVSTRQPMNTFVGPNMGPSPNDGMLMPLPADISLTSSLASLNDPGNCTPVLSLDITKNGTSTVGGFSWAGDTHAYWAAYTLPVTPPLTVTSVAIGSAARTSCAPCWFSPASEILFLGSNGTSLFRVSAGASPSLIGTATIPAGCIEIIAWGEFVFADTGTGKLYYSNPSTAATWTSTDFIAIPPTKGPNTGIPAKLVLHQGSLWISTESGWWVASGIPNSTLSLRQVTTVATGCYPVSIDTSIVSTAEPATTLTNFDTPPLGPLFRELVGNRDRPLSFAMGVDGQPYPDMMTGLSRFGNYVVGFSSNAIDNAIDEGSAEYIVPAHTFWVLDVRTGVWVLRRTEWPAAPASGKIGISLQSRADLLVYRNSNPDALYGAWIGQPDLYANQDDTYPAATVSLAEYYHRVPFIVKEVICEVDYGRAGQTAPASGQDRSIGVAVKTTGVPIEYGQDMSLTRAQSSTMTEALPSYGQTGPNYTPRRQWVRFNPTDGNDTYTATPVVTLQGLKLRRLIMRCAEVG